MPSQCPVMAGATYTDSNGVARQSPFEHQTAGYQGPLLLQDTHLVDNIVHHNRERIPERVVHAKGAGAHGIWETTADVSDICCADLLQKGKTAPLTARFSTVGGESGSSDTARDPRGFSLKVKTEEGNWDFVGNNTPVFFLRDPHKFVHLIHTQKRNPQTHLKDKNDFWGYFASNAECAHQVMILFSDRGITSYAHMNGYGGHTFKWVNAKGEWHYVKIHILADKGVKTFTQEEAAAKDGENPDSGTEELFTSIEKGDFPTWKVFIQTMTFEQAKEFRYSVFDLTKVWSHKEFPLREIAKVTLNKNPQNYFTEVEQVAFSPGNLVPGMEPSNDPVLQSRVFSYPDAQRYRLSINYNNLPVNCPVTNITNFHRDGVMAGITGNGGPSPNYPAPQEPLKYTKRPYTLEQITDPQENHKTMYFTTEVTDLDFEQPKGLWEKVFDDGQRERYVQNVAGHLGGAKPEVIRAVLDNIFRRIDEKLASRIEEAIGNPKTKNAIPVTDPSYQTRN